MPHQVLCHGVIGRQRSGIIGGVARLRGRCKAGDHHASLGVYIDGLPVDAAGELPDGRTFQDIRDFKRLVREDDVLLARNLARQLTVYATGAPVSFGDRDEIEAIVGRTSVRRYGLRSLIHEIVQSPLFLNK